MEATSTEERIISEKEKNERTVFVGNVSVSVKEKQLKRLFKTFGKIESIRFRGSVSSNPKLSKKVAGQKKRFHEKQQSHLAYVVFAEKSSAVSSLKLNGVELEQCHLRVDLVTRSDPKVSPSVFVGNLPFHVTDEALYNLFTPCGTLVGTRVIRDRATGMGKGFGYVNFESKDSIIPALKLDGAELEGRNIRVKKIQRENSKEKTRVKLPSKAPKTKDVHLKKKDQGGQNMVPQKKLDRKGKKKLRKKKIIKTNVR